MTDTTIPGPPWIPRFLKQLCATRCVTQAIAAAGVTPGTVYFQRKRNQQFAEARAAIIQLIAALVTAGILPAA